MILGNLTRATSARLRALDERNSVREAADAFSNGHLGLMIVCDGSGKATGVVSKSDLVRHLAQAGGDRRSGNRDHVAVGHRWVAWR